MTKRTRYTILIGLGLVGVFLAPIITLAAGWGGLNIPYWGPLVACQENATLDSPGYCTNLCQITELADHVIKFGFTILLFVIAPIMIVVGGGMILIAGASEKLLSQGKTILKGAVVGVVLALLAYVIVGTFLWMIGNKAGGPDVARVSWPTVQCSPGAAPGNVALGNPAGAGTGGGTTEGGPGGGITLGVRGCPGEDCYSFYGSGDGGLIFKDGVGHKATSKMIDAIYCFDDRYSGQIRVTEAYPPTPGVNHSSPQHYNGCAIDWTIPVGSTYNTSSYSIFIKPAAESCGFWVKNEYTNPSRLATEKHFHFQLPSSTCP